MAVHEIIPSSNVLAVDIRDTLGESTNALERLCTSPNINMFSLKKPVHLNRLGYFPALNSDWYKGEYFDYGIEIPNIQLSEAESVHWRYDRPKGGVNSAYRLTDFVGYYHKALRMTTIHMPSPIYTNSKRVEFVSTFAASSDKQIGHDLLFPNRNRWLCLILKRSDGQYRVKTSDVPIGDESGMYDRVIAEKNVLTWMGSGTHKAIFILCNERIVDWTSAPPSRLLYYAGYADAVDSNVKSLNLTTFYPPPEVVAVVTPDEIEYCMTKETFSVSVTALEDVSQYVSNIKGTMIRSDGKQTNVTLNGVLPDLCTPLTMGGQIVDYHFKMNKGDVKNATMTINSMWVDSNGQAIRPPSTDERFTFMINFTMPSSVYDAGDVLLLDHSCECYSKLKF